MTGPDPSRMRAGYPVRLAVMSGVCLLLCLPVQEAFTEQPDKEKSQEAPPPPIQSRPEPQPAPPKLSTEPKPTAPTPPPGPSVVKPEKPESPPEQEKEPAKKRVGSLILTVKLVLLGDPRLVHYEIEVEEKAQIITLTGRVSNEQEKTAASETAKAVPGVNEVVNKLEVDKELGQAVIKRQDENITSLIKERFARSATLKSANFDVKTEEGVVSISGAVRFQVIALEAAQAARQVPGVKAVKTNKIRLEGEG